MIQSASERLGEIYALKRSLNMYVSAFTEAAAAEPKNAIAYLLRRPDR
jgi:hypothetical protein